MVYFPAQQGLHTCSFNSTVEEIKKIIDLEIPVIVLQKPVKRVKKGHYRVVFGYDDTWEIFFVHDPMMGANRGIKYEEFRELWHFGDNPNQHNWTLAVFSEEKASVFPDVKDSYVHHLNMATALYKRKSYQAAIEAWKKATEMNGQAPQAFYCLAQVLLDSGETEEALVFARKAVDVGGDDPFAWDVLGLVCHEKEMYLEAAEAMVKAVKLCKKEHTFIQRHWLKIRNSYINWKKEKRS
jgi:tetratricopeptide (TPR) repeat protein